MSRRRFIKIVASSVLALPLANFSFAKESKLKKFTWVGVALGADVSMTIISDDRKQAHIALEKSLEEIKKMEGYFSLYKKDSLLNLLNQSRKLDYIPNEFSYLIEKSIEYSQKTEGYFDVTAGSPSGSYKDIILEKRRVILDDSKINLSFNGIAQGFITDQVKKILENNKIANSLIELGEKYALGDSYNIALENPLDNSIKEVVAIKNQAIATSSNYGNYLEQGRGHITNPHSKKTPDNLISVSVIADNATKADAFSTAIVATGNKNIANRIVEKNRVKAIFL